MSIVWEEEEILLFIGSWWDDVIALGMPLWSKVVPKCYVYTGQLYGTEVLMTCTLSLPLSPLFPSLSSPSLSLLSFPLSPLFPSLSSPSLSLLAFGRVWADSCARQFVTSYRNQLSNASELNTLSCSLVYMYTFIVVAQRSTVEGLKREG